MTLPGVPDAAMVAAITATNTGLGCTHGFIDCTQCLPEAAVRAAWPHLYALALRHAADRALDHQERWGADPLDVHLRQWADEAVREHG